MEHTSTALSKMAHKLGIAQIGLLHQQQGMFKVLLHGQDLRYRLSIENSPYRQHDLALRLPELRFKHHIENHILLYALTDHNGHFLWLEFIAPVNASHIESIQAELDLMAIFLLRLSEQNLADAYFNNILDNSPSLISIKDFQGNIVLVNRQFDVLEGPGHQGFVGKNLFDVFPREVAEQLWQNDLAARHARKAITSEEVVRHKDGKNHTYLTVKFPLIQHQDVIGTCAISTDITERKAYERRLKASEASLRIMLENNPSPVVIIDAETGRFVEANRNAERFYGLSRFQLASLTPAHVSPQYQADGRDSMQVAQEYIQRALDGEQPHFEWLHQHSSGQTIPCEVRLVALPRADKPWVMGSLMDVSDRVAREHALRSERDRLSYLAHHDPLTGLPNRLLFHDRLDHALQRAQRHNSKIALLLLDLDGFKEINDKLGHKAGDQVLITVAQRISKITRSSDTAARLAGDEFVVLLENLMDQQEAQRVAQKIVTSLHQPFEILDGCMTISASVGVAHYPDNGSDADMLLSCADKAMYNAKNSGKNQVKTFH